MDEQKAKETGKKIREILTNLEEDIIYAEINPGTFKIRYADKNRDISFLKTELPLKEEKILAKSEKELDL